MSWHGKCGLLSTKPRVAVVGAGQWGKNLVRVFHGLDALAAVCDMDPAARDRVTLSYPGVPIFGSLDEVLNVTGLDAIVLAVPAMEHYAAA